MKEHCVSYEVAKLLREKGFNILVNHFYSQSGKLFPRVVESGYEPMTFEADDFYENFNTIVRYEVEGKYQTVFSAPTLHQVVDWFRDVKSLIIEVIHSYSYTDRSIITWHIKIDNKYGMSFVKKEEFNYYSYEEAMQNSILIALGLIDEKKLKKGGDLKDNSKNKNMSEENEFVEIADYGDQMYFTRDFGHVIVGDDEKEIPLVLVATIENFYEATGDDRFEEKPFMISLSIYPSIEFIDKAHIESCADSAGIEPEEVGYTDLVSYGLGIPLNLKNLEEGYAEMNDAEEFLKSKELKDQLNSQQMMVGWYMDGAINRAGSSRWAYLEHSLDKSKSW